MERRPTKVSFFDQGHGVDERACSARPVERVTVVRPSSAGLTGHPRLFVKMEKIVRNGRVMRQHVEAVNAETVFSSSVIFVA